MVDTPTGVVTHPAPVPPSDNRGGIAIGASCGAAPPATAALSQRPGAPSPSLPSQTPPKVVAVALSVLLPRFCRASAGRAEGRRPPAAEEAAPLPPPLLVFPQSLCRRQPCMGVVQEQQRGTIRANARGLVRWIHMGAS